MKINNWPLLYSDILRIKDPQHHLGICCLWTERSIVEKILQQHNYNVIGNLYSAQGINSIIRNIFANPYLRTIIIWGSEMSLSGHALIQFIESGLDSDYRIKNARGEIESTIPKKSIDQFRCSVNVIDLRGRDADTLKTTVAEHQSRKLKPFSAKPQYFPRSNPKTTVFPSEQTGFHVSAPKVASTWLKLLNEINKYGRPKHTRYSKDNELKEILNLTAVIADENTHEPYFPKYLPFTELELNSYYAEIMTSRKIPGVAYNYGKRLRQDLGVDQIESIRQLLKKRPTSKKMAATTMNPQLDWDQTNKGDTPCLTHIYGSMQDNRFFLTAHFRSQDMVHGWPRNTFALRRLQEDLAQSASLKVGPLTIITHSAHIYSDDFQLVSNLIEDNYEAELGYTPSVHFDFDPRGNMIVEVIDQTDAHVWDKWSKRYDKISPPYAVVKTLSKMKDYQKLIRATLFSPDGGKPLKIFEGRTAQEVVWQITDYKFLKDPGHLMYIGLELQKAEAAITQNKRYNQDPA